MTITPVSDAFAAIAARRTERRRFLTLAGSAAASAGGLALLSACGNNGTSNATPTPTPTASASTGISDVDILNFALNLEYLEAQYYNFAAYGTALANTSGIGTAGAITGGAQVPFTDPLVAQYAREIAADEAAHVNYLKTTIGGAAVAMPAINIDGSATGAFTAAARAAGVIGDGATFNPYASDENFLLGAFLFEDVGVTAYKGAASLIGNSIYVDVAAGILATEAYHAGLIRSVLYRKGIEATPALLTNAQKISDARDTLDGAATDDDQGIGDATAANLVPADANALAYGRSAARVLNIVYLTSGAAVSGGFFPSGLNGNIRASTAAS